MRLVALALCVQACVVLLAGCATPIDGDGGELSGAGGGRGGGDDRPVAPEVRFEPDLDALSREFCSTGNLTLPVPRFGDVRFTGTEEPVHDTPSCDLWNDPESSAED